MGRLAVETPNNFCRLCKCSFIAKYGSKVQHMSSQNIFKASQRKDSFGKILSDLCGSIQITIKSESSLSTKVCNTCSRKLLRVYELYQEVKTKINEPHSNYKTATPAKVLQDITNNKRQLLTPDRGASPGDRKSCRIESNPSKSKRRLERLFNTEDSEEKQTYNEDDNVLSNLNVDGLKSCDGRSASKMKVVIVHPNGDVVVRNPTNEKTVQIIRNLCVPNWTAVANGIFDHEDSDFQQELRNALQKKVNKEFKAYSKSDSALKATASDELASFSNKLVVVESKLFCPLWYSCINGAAGKKVNVNHLALLTAFAARVRNPKMSAVAFRISNLLVHSGAKFQDIKRLCILGICMTPKSTVRLQERMGATFDALVLKWKSEIEENRHKTSFLQEILQNQVHSTTEDEDSMVLEVKCDINEDELKSYTNYQPSLHKNLQETFGSTVVTDDCIQRQIFELQMEKLPLYKIIADNIDLEIASRIQSKEHHNKSIHWTHQFVLLDRVCVPDIYYEHQDKPKEAQLIDLLPTKQVQERLMWRMAVLVSRVVTKYLVAFGPLKNAVHYHIPHQYSKEMEQKSVSCSLGVEFFNANVAGEMAQLMQKNQSKYVPLMPDGCSVAETVPFHGDQLFEERSRNVKWTFQDGDSSVERLEGLEPEFADWHAKFTLYKAENKLFVNHDSAGEIGTSMASINRTSKSNAAKDAHNHFNEYSEFHSREVEAHICAAFMEQMGMDKIDANPDIIIPDSSVSLSTKQQWLQELCYKFVGNYVFNSNDIRGLVDKTADLELKSKPPYQCRVQHCDKTYQFHSVRVRHEIQIHNFTASHYEEDERDNFGYYFCRHGCNFVFSTKAVRNRHESEEHEQSNKVNGEGGSEEPIAKEAMELLFDDSKTEHKPEADDDYIFNYHQAKLTFGLVLAEFKDAVKEGDGERLFDLYKLCLLIFKSLGHTKYAYVVLLYLAKIRFFLSEKEAFRLKWNRFYNHYGGKGRNISLDLRKEQQNAILKKMWKSLGPNLNKKSAKRISESLDMHEMLIESVDKDCNLSEREGYRSNPKQEEAVRQITKDLVDNQVFNFTKGRLGYECFPNFDANIVKLDYRDLHKWIKDHLKLWGSIYS